MARMALLVSLKVMRESIQFLVLLAHRRHESTWCKTRFKASSTVASCLIEPHCSVDPYPTDCLIRCPSFVPP